MLYKLVIIITLEISETTRTNLVITMLDCICFRFDGSRRKGFVVEREDIGGGEFLGSEVAVSF